jgi:hypothetical protein
MRNEGSRCGRAQDVQGRAQFHAAGISREPWTNWRLTWEARRKKAGGWCGRETNLAGSPTLLRKAAQPVLLSRLACSAGMEVDDLAPQLFRRPPRLRRLEVCRNVEFNQFRHHVLLAGNPTPLGVREEPPQKSQPVQAHVSLFPQSICSSSKLSAANKNTEAKEEFFIAMRQTTQVAECRALSPDKNRSFSSTQSSATNTCGLSVVICK